jgi:membrane associated rhomboid family serine protease
MNEPTVPITIAIMAVTGLVSFGGFRSPALVERFLFEPSRIVHHGEYYRLITSGFIHANWAHLIFNMFGFYSFGGLVESRFGVPVLLAVYFSGILGGNLVSLVLHRNHVYRALGASGGVCGIIFATIFLVPGSGVYIFPLPVPIPAHIFAILFILISFFGVRGGRGNIGHDAHLGGAIIGLAVTSILHPEIISDNFILWVIVMSLALVLFLYLYKRPLYPAQDPRSFSREHEETGRRPW